MKMWLSPCRGSGHYGEVLPWPQVRVPSLPGHPFSPQRKWEGHLRWRVPSPLPHPVINQSYFVILPAINGKIYNSLLGLTMNEGDRTNWYLIGMGNEVDIHTVHFHAQTFIFKVGKIHQSKTFIVWWEISAKKVRVLAWFCSLGTEPWADAEVSGSFACEGNTKWMRSLQSFYHSEPVLKHE